MPSAWEWFETAAEALSELGVRWCRAGALAALEYRHVPRLTTDADLLVEWHDDLVDHLGAAGYRLVVFRDQGEHPHLLVNRTGPGGRVDFIIAGTEYQHVALDRAVSGGHVLTVEDVVVHKLIAWRPRDRDDVRSILEAGHDLDETYVSDWAAAWQVTDRWREAKRWGGP